MTEETKKQPAIDMNKVKNKLLQQKAEITRLEEETKALRDELKSNKEEQHRITTESQLVIDDSELARSFTQKNYAPLLLTLFEKPSRKIRNTAIVALLLSIITAIAIGYFSASYLSYTHNKITDKKIDALQNKIDQSLFQQQKLQAAIDQQKADSEKTKNNTSKIAAAKAQKSYEEKTTAFTAPNEKIIDIAKQKQISQQAESILRYVKSAEQQEGFLDDYINDKTQFAQLYLIVMQYASNDNIHYESYLQAIKSLGISDSIAPKTTQDLLKIDLDFLYATYSGWAVTTKKKENGWRYRDEDRRFSSFYNGSLDYDLGAWQIINETRDYKTLPNIFSLNIERITQQIIFNGERSSVRLPEFIYYLAYAEDNKNKAIENLFNQENVKNVNGKLKIVSSTGNIPANTIINDALISE
jgi:hypothetical protein